MLLQEADQELGVGAGVPCEEGVALSAVKQRISSESRDDADRYPPGG